MMLNTGEKQDKGTGQTSGRMVSDEERSVGMCQRMCMAKQFSG